MHILLVAATSFEIQPTVDWLSKSRSSAHPTILIPGVGALPTTWSIMRQIDRGRPDLIIQAGIAGSFTNRTPGDVLAIRDETIADLGVWEDNRFKTPFDLRLADPNEPPFTAGRLINPHRSLLSLTGLEEVSAITVNEISTDPERIAWYRNNLSPVTESMEGAALHYIGLRERIPFLQLRSVSNDVGIRDKSKWNIPLAIRQLNDRLVQLLQQLDPRDTTILNAINDAS